MASGGASPGSSAVTVARSAGYVPRTQSRWAGLVPNLIFYPIELLGGMTQLGGRVLASAVMRPVGYWRAVRDEMYFVLKTSWFPIVAAVFTFGIMVGIVGLNFTRPLGAGNRYGQYFFIVNIREFTPWINSMVVAGVIGAAICSDLGARKIREELDALQVLGTDPVRELVLPRIVSITLLTPMLMVVSVIIGMVCALISSVSYGGVPANEYLTLVYSNLTVVELVGAWLKSIMIGLVIGVVCAYKGLHCSGGAIGVGRAVNQAVVLSFVLVFLIDGVFNMIMLGLFPQLQILR
ncbi:ABC transporter permease [Pseudonocardia eucalypti]|uniref:ABC transporter permease n=1 Tax=Pseudonocardia eucalypti TaxID=648755 RepID=A0ABP9Q530_9PSEU